MFEYRYVVETLPAPPTQEYLQKYGSQGYRLIQILTIAPSGKCMVYLVHERKDLASRKPNYNKD